MRNVEKGRLSEADERKYGLGMRLYIAACRGELLFFVEPEGREEEGRGEELVIGEPGGV